MRAKKSLGQNFLKSQPALKKIAEAGEIKSSDIILEIGPGKGALTEKLLERGGLVVAVEKDNELFEYLKEKFSKEVGEGRLLLVRGDILEFNMKQNVLERTLGRSDGDGQRKFSTENFRGESENILRNYKIIANIPYNITGAVLKKFLTAEHQPERMVLLVQREVAQRIVASPRHGGAGNGKESMLSISVKAYGEPKMLMKVPARYFSPSPKVDSAIVSIKNISRKVFEENGINEERFWEIVRSGFAHKRKKLSSNLKKGGKIASPGTLAALGNKRAENLSLSEWINLGKASGLLK